MDRFKLIILNLFVPVSVSVFVFLLIYTNGFCSSLALSQGASQTLGNSLGSVFDLSGISASPDPVGLSIGLSQIYDRLDLYLYQNYDYDLSGTVNDTLENGASYINQDTVLQDSFVSTITNGLYNNMQELTGYGYALYKAATMELQNAKDTFFIGKQQDGVITEVLDNAVVYVDDDVLNAYSSSLDNAITNNFLLDFSRRNHFLYGSSFRVTQTTSLGTVIQSFNLSEECCVCRFNTAYEYLAVVTTNPNISGSGISIQPSGSTIVMNGIHLMGGSMAGSFVVDGVTYYYDQLAYNGSWYVTTNQSIGILQDVIDSVTNNGTGSFSSIYSLSPDIEATIKELLAELKGHYVSTSDLDLIIDSLIDNGVITNEDVVIDGVTENVPVIDWSQDYIDTLEGIIEGILDNSAVYDDVISDSNTITPNPIQDVNQGIDIPSGFNGDILTSFTNIVTLPTKFFSVFEPLFKILGNNPPILGLWLFFPIFLLIMFIIWALK